MALYRALVTINMESNVPEDASTNTWYFDVDTDEDLPGPTQALNDLYAAMGSWWSSDINTGFIQCEWYRLSDTPPRAPVSTSFFSSVPKASDAGPHEVALVLSYQGAKISGLPQARRRGRVYMGPLYGSMPGRPPQTMISDLNNAASAMLDDSDSATTWTWAQWSPTNQLGIDVRSGWVDNAWDTQRRRGRRATGRSTFAN